MKNIKYLLLSLTLLFVFNVSLVGATTLDNDSAGYITMPLDLFKEICLYYMDDFDITDINDLTNKNKEIFRFVLINLSHHKLTIADINELYAEINSE